MRAQVNYIFICAETNSSTKQKLYQHYGGMFPTYEIFDQTLTALTQNDGCLVIDNTTCSDRLEDQVFWYRPGVSKSSKFRLCDPKIWKRYEV